MGNFFENWVELDLNPIISFSSSGKILYSNQEAQFLLSRISQKEIFDIAIKYAPKTFGVETTYIDLHLKNYTFYAITISYEDEEAINIKLYKSTMVKKESKLNTKNSDIGNIFTLVDLSISAMKLKSNIKYIKNYDPSIPDFKLNASEIIKVLNINKKQAFFKVELPLVLPIIISGIRLTTIYSISIATIATLVGAGGLGDLIYLGLQQQNILITIKGVIPLILMTIIVNFIFNKIELKVLPADQKWIRKLDIR